MGGSHIAKGEKVLNKFKIPSFRYPERAVKAIAKMCQWGEYRNAINTNSETQTLESESDFFEQKQNQGSDSAEIISSILTTDRKNLDSFEANQILEAYGINTPSTKKCESIDNAKSFVQENNFPVVLKISSPQMLHKSDEGGVIAGIDNNEKLDESFDRLKKIIDGMGDSSINAIQIQKQVTKGLELIIGSKKDLVFGNVLMFGAGGVLANLIEDRNLGLIPLNKVEVITLIKNSKVNKLIEGYRGEKGFESEKLVDLILKFQKMINSNPEISEADINPVILNDDGIWAVDGKMILI